MNESRSREGCGMALHAVIPLVTLSGPVHLGVAFSLFVFDRAGRGDDHCVNDGTALPHNTFFLLFPRELIKENLVQIVLFKEMTELAQRCFIRNRFGQKVDPDKLTHCVAVADCGYCPWGRKIEPDLQHVLSQHLLKADRRTPAVSFRVKQLDAPDPVLPRNSLLHHVQESILPCDVHVSIVNDIFECYLPILHDPSPSN